MIPITIIIASYNYERYLGAAIQSALNQSFTNFELIIVDDGSKDASVELAQSFAQKDPRVRVLMHSDEKNHGLPATLQLGLNNAQGEYIAFLESDDLWRPDCLEKRLAALVKNTAGVVFNGVEPLPMPGADTAWFDSYVPRIMKEHTLRRSTSGNVFPLTRGFLVENKIPTFSCAMVRTELLRNCDFTSPVPRWMDWWLWSQIARQTQFCFIPALLTRWRLHAKSFNHKIALSRYWIDSAVIWKGFRRLFRNKDWATGHYSEALLLSSPFWLRLVLRFGMITRQSGLRETILKIYKRLR